MAAKIYYQEDCNLSLLDGKKIAIIGYGSQGHAHELNLKESGCDVIIGLYNGSKSWAKAEKQGFKVYTAAEAAKQADIIMILINDELQADMYKNDIEPNLEPGNMLMFAHGFTFIKRYLIIIGVSSAKMYKTDKTTHTQTGRTVGKDKYCRFLKKVQVFPPRLGNCRKICKPNPKKTIHFDGKMMYYNGNERDRPP